ncbi:hypothetical protein [Pelobacter propionicus]|uniref:hypothetical protein n=1 Tax=Pelobacter propionicus TaxID=29543 RepID=UPI0002E64B30|nr:hypothetical protein [Pelobacter propionicus]
MKKAALAIVAVISFVVMMICLFSGGHIRLFGVPVSGAVFALILRAAVKELEQ